DVAQVRVEALWVTEAARGRQRGEDVGDSRDDAGDREDPHQGAAAAEERPYEGDHDYRQDHRPERAEAVVQHREELVVPDVRVVVVLAQAVRLARIEAELVGPRE